MRTKLRIALISEVVRASQRARVSGVCEIAQQCDWIVSLVRPRHPRMLERLDELHPDGLIAYMPEERVLRWGKRRKIPLVELTWCDGEGRSFVTVNEVELGRTAAAHLAEPPRSSYGFCGVRGHPASDMRHAYFAQGLGRSAEEVHRFDVGADDSEIEYRRILRFVRDLKFPAAVLAMDDEIGRRILDAVQLEGIAIPRDLAVLGVGGDELLGEIMHPTLSSVGIPGRAIGRAAGRLLADIVEGKEKAPMKLLIPPQPVMARESTRGLSTDHPLVSRALEAARARFAGGLSAGEIARAVHVSERTLQRKFREVLRMGVGEALVQMRMQRARTLLAVGTETIDAVAAQSGYESGAAFARAFRRETGMWPGEFRRAIQTQ